ncbi:serine protease inhibitor dipetalogastin-like [Pectinophora gossypiella]|uniref:serine protease inhibitor dipetalogastin-like n=1 Tax=Pectinophora gossypiella TaxID=13191 RepID=UPI00214E6A2F|nr:serine protease inhibitor dipetalogastin-like [Pectinophora gossypiella]
MECHAIVVISVVMAFLVLVRSDEVYCPVAYRTIGPICGTDGSLYTTWCDLEMARVFNHQLDVAHMGPCRSDCSYEYMPVCGNDLVTYDNLCFFQEEASRPQSYGLRVLHFGQCNNYRIVPYIT